MEKVIKLNSYYSFKDAESVAQKKGVSVSQAYYELEKTFDDPRASIKLRDVLADFHDAIINENKFNDGIEQRYAYNGYTVLDLNLRRPAFNSYAFKHVPHIYGGGAVEIDKGFFFKPNTRTGRLASSRSNKVNLVSTNSETLEAPILPITLGLSVGVVEKMKEDQIGFDVISANHEAVRLSYYLELDKFAFVGHRGIDGTSTDHVGMARGLINLSSDQATIIDLDNTTYTPALQNTVLEAMTTPELVTVLAEEYLKALQLAAFDPELAPNKWLVYPTLLSKLSKPAHIAIDNGTVFRSQLEYIRQCFRDWAVAYSAPEVQIEALPYLEPIASMTGFDPILNEDGTNGTGRTILYRQDPYVFRSRIAMDLTPGALVFDAANNEIRRNYVAFIGTPLVFYDGFIRYIDNGTTVYEPETEEEEEE